MLPWRYDICCIPPSKYNNTRWWKWIFWILIFCFFFFVLHRFIIVVEHDLSVLDYLSDFICCLYGVPGCYGVVTMPFSVREGINIFLDGFVPTENMRFRTESLTFKVSYMTWYTVWIVKGVLDFFKLKKLWKNDKLLGQHTNMFPDLKVVCWERL